MASAILGVHLHKALSIRVPLLKENLVGDVILGKKLCDIILSRYSLNQYWSLVCFKKIHVKITEISAFTIFIVNEFKNSRQNFYSLGPNFSEENS